MLQKIQTLILTMIHNDWDYIYIDEHIILVESNFNWFNTTFGFNIKKHILQKGKYWWIEMFKINDVMVKKA
jgi:hypothetical protein